MFFYNVFATVYMLTGFNKQIQQKNIRDEYISSYVKMCPLPDG